LTQLFRVSVLAGLLLERDVVVALELEAVALDEAVAREVEEPVELLLLRPLAGPEDEQPVEAEPVRSEDVERTAVLSLEIGGRRGALGRWRARW